MHLRKIKSSRLLGFLTLSILSQLFSDIALALPSAPELVYRFQTPIREQISTYTVTLLTARYAGALTANYIQTPQCTGFSAIIETANSTSGMVPTIFQNNRFYPQVQPVQSIKFTFINSGAPQTCTILIFQDSSTPRQRILLGSLKYSGGFDPEATMLLPSAVNTDKVEIFRPQYCKSIDILEGSIRAASALPPTSVSVTRPEWFVITLSQPTKINAVILSISGPPDQTCEFPIYGWIW